jgi:hypothetical protein
MSVSVFMCVYANVHSTQCVSFYVYVSLSVCVSEFVCDCVCVCVCV